MTEPIFRKALKAASHDLLSWVNYRNSLCYHKKKIKGRGVRCTSNKKTPNSSLPSQQSYQHHDENLWKLIDLGNHSHLRNSGRRESAWSMLSITPMRLGHTTGILTWLKKEQSSLKENHVCAESDYIPVRIMAAGVGTSEVKSDEEDMG